MTRRPRQPRRRRLLLSFGRRAPVRTLPQLLAALRLLTLLIVLSATVSAQEPPRIGVFVESVTPNEAAARAGLHEGDLIQSWQRGTAQGPIGSPFDLMQIEVEQAPLGPVALEGKRDGQQQRWSMGVDEWGLRSRPILTQALQELYEEGKRQEDSGDSMRAAQQWRAAGAASQSPTTSWLAPWFLHRTAESLAAAHQKQKSDETYREAVEAAANSKPLISVQLLQSWANTCKQQSDWDCAQKHYRQSLAEGQKWNVEPLTIAVSLHGLGSIFDQRDDFALAAEYYEQALAIREKLAPESLLVASSLSDIGLLSYRRGDLIHAEEHARRALSIRESLAPESPAVADSLDKLGMVFESHGDLAKAEDYFSRANAIKEKLTPASLDVALSFTNIGRILAKRGDLAQGEAYFARALALKEKWAPGSLLVASNLTNLGTTFLLRGDLVKGEEYLRRGLALEERLAPKSLHVANTLNNLGLVAFQRGNLAKAEEYLERSLAIRRELAPASLDVADSLDNVGALISQRGDFAKAEKYLRQALAILEKEAPGSLNVAFGLDNFGDLFKTRGDLARATHYYRRALSLREKLAPGSLDLTITLNNLGEISYKSGNLAKAERYYTQALTIIEKLSPGSSSDADTLAALGRLNRRRGKLDTAAELFSQALRAVEHQTSRLGGTASERTRFRSNHVSYYKDYLDVLLAQNKTALAFQVLERSRARSFLELLAERDLAFATDLPAEIQQARQENAAGYDRTQARIAKLSLQKDGAQIEQLQKQLRGLETEREEIGERVRQRSPHFAALQYPQPLDLDTVRTALDPGTALLSYSVGDEHAVVFVVLPAGQTPGLSVFDLKVTGKTLRQQVDSLRKLIQHEGDGTTQRESRQISLTALERELYELLLAPAESILASSQRLLLIPDGPLQILPFAALKDKSGRYLVEWKPLHSAISATVYAELKRARPTKPDKPVELAAFGDPLYPPSVQAAINVNAVDTRGYTLSRLPFSRVEVQSIAGLFAGNTLKYLADQATEEHAKALGKDVRYIHFATHGLLDERFPLNSSLALTIPSNPTEGQENGFLQAWEIFEQVRLDADLVTLSACSTGLGQEMNGEGLIGLTRAFQYAGAHSVLASLWSVDDYRTMQLMKRFYAELHAGASKDDALRTAQLQLIHSTSSDPHDWAAFSLTGDWH